jgi:hypothetical protein
MTWFGFGVADGLDLEIHPGELKFVIPCIASDSFFFFFFFHHLYPYTFASKQKKPLNACDG